MNSRHDDKKLDELLNHWAEQSQSPERLSNLHDRIVSSLKNPESLCKDKIASPRLPNHGVGRSRTTSTFVIGMAVTSLLSIAIFLSRWNGFSVSTAVDLPPRHAWFQEEQIRNKSVLLTEMETVFDQPLVWLAETENRIEFGIDEFPEHQTADFDNVERLAVRVVVERRPYGKTTWQPAWAMDVVSRSEDLIHVAPREANGNELRLWTYQLPDGAIAIDSEIRLSGLDSLRVETSRLHHDSDPVKIATLRNNGIEYRVFQTVAVLMRKTI